MKGVLQLLVLVSLYTLGYIETTFASPHPFRVTSILIEPYLMINAKYANHTSNRRFHGYIVDLLDELSGLVGFRYQISLVPDGSFGYQRPDGSWDGMIGELQRNKADIAAAPLYFTDERGEAVTFSMPFMHVYATVMMRQSTMYKLAPPIASARDLLYQNVFHYGTLNSGVLVYEFRHTNDSEYRRLGENIRHFSPTAFTATNKDGIERVRREDYAFIIPSDIGDYMALQPPCDLVAVDRFLMQRHFSLAIPKQSLMQSDINKGLEILERSGLLDKLYNKWWKDKSNCNSADAIKSSYVMASQSSTNPLTAMHYISVLAIFVVLFQRGCL